MHTPTHIHALQSIPEQALLQQIWVTFIYHPVYICFHVALGVRDDHIHVCDHGAELSTLPGMWGVLHKLGLYECEEGRTVKQPLKPTHGIL